MPGILDANLSKNKLTVTLRGGSRVHSNTLPCMHVVLVRQIRIAGCECQGSCSLFCIQYSGH